MQYLKYFVTYLDGGGVCDAAYLSISATLWVQSATPAATPPKK